LDIKCACQPNYQHSDADIQGIHPFDTQQLAGLTRLHTLRLEGFDEPGLLGLPPSLRTLHVLGGGKHIYFFDKQAIILPRCMFGMLPEHCRWGRRAASAALVAHAVPGFADAPLNHGMARTGVAFQLILLYPGMHQPRLAEVLKLTAHPACPRVLPALQAGQCATAELQP
jgi:hypothetical protein